MTWRDISGALLTALLDSSLRSLVACVVVGASLGGLRVRSSAVRHPAWTALLAAMLAMPLLTRAVPRVEIALPSPPIWTVPDRINTDALPPSPTSVPTRIDSVPARVTIENGTSSPATPNASAPSPPRSAKRADWSAVAAALYLSVALALLARLMFGWRAARRLSARSTPVTLGNDAAVLRTPYRRAAVRESAHVASPITLGIVTPIVVLPMAWRTWPGWKLRAVLAHERAHVGRHDTAVAFLAGINCCLFWFNPAAWWLRAELMRHAEHLSDEAAVSELGSADRYAEILLEMARSIRARHGRLSWAGVGIDGSGLLGVRIDRVLGGGSRQTLSRVRLTAVAAACLLAISLAAACGRRPPPPPPLAPMSDAEQDERVLQQRADAAFATAVAAMTADAIAAVDAQWRRNPEDLVALRKLLLYYRHDFSGKNNPGQQRIAATRREYILWLIEHHPDHELAGGWSARIFPTPMDPLPDPTGYAAAKRVWLTHTASPDVAVAVLSNAAYFFEANDKALAEAMLLRAQAKAPSEEYARRLGRLYALVLVGSNASTPLNVVRYSSLDDSRSVYAQTIRAKLESSTDDVLLTAAGSWLSQTKQHFSGANRNLLDFDPAALGRSYVERAASLNPDSFQARRWRWWMRSLDRRNRLWDLAGRPETRSASDEELLARTPDADRLALLVTLAERRYFAGERAVTERQDENAKSEWARSRGHANEILKLAAQHPDSPDYSTAVFGAHMTLSTLAMRAGHQKEAVKYMLAASMVPPSEDLEYQSGVASHLPIAYLLKYGERESVIEYMERMAGKVTAEKSYLLESADAIRRGRQPGFYTAQIKD